MRLRPVLVPLRTFERLVQKKEIVWVVDVNTIPKRSVVDSAGFATLLTTTNNIFSMVRSLVDDSLGRTAYEKLPLHHPD